jgi:hypothetical protein
LIQHRRFLFYFPLLGGPVVKNMQESFAVLYSNPKQFVLHNGLQSAATLNCCPGCEFDIPVADAEAGVHKVVPDPKLTHSNTFQSKGSGVGAGVGTTVGVGGVGAGVGGV